jgi:hypothetical protein
MRTANEPILNSNERLAWSMTTPNLLRECPYYLWSQVYDLAIKKIGHVIYRGDHWQEQVEAKAEAILAELGIEVEHHAGQRYLGGKRVYWNSVKGRWEQDDFR